MTGKTAVSSNSSPTQPAGPAPQSVSALPDLSQIIFAGIETSNAIAAHKIQSAPEICPCGDHTGAQASLVSGSGTSTTRSDSAKATGEEAHPAEARTTATEVKSAAQVVDLVSDIISAGIAISASLNSGKLEKGPEVCPCDAHAGTSFQTTPKDSSVIEKTSSPAARAEGTNGAQSPDRVQTTADSREAHSTALTQSANPTSATASTSTVEVTRPLSEPIQQSFSLRSDVARPTVIVEAKPTDALLATATSWQLTERASLLAVSEGPQSPAASSWHSNHNTTATVSWGSTSSTPPSREPSASQIGQSSSSPSPVAPTSSPPTPRQFSSMQLSHNATHVTQPELREPFRSTPTRESSFKAVVRHAGPVLAGTRSNRVNPSITSRIVAQKRAPARVALRRARTRIAAPAKQSRKARTSKIGASPARVRANSRRKIESSRVARLERRIVRLPSGRIRIMRASRLNRMSGRHGKNRVSRTVRSYRAARDRLNRPAHRKIAAVTRNRVQLAVRVRSSRPTARVPIKGRAPLRSTSRVVARKGAKQRAIGTVRETTVATIKRIASKIVPSSVKRTSPNPSLNSAVRKQAAVRSQALSVATFAALLLKMTTIFPRSFKIRSNKAESNVLETKRPRRKRAKLGSLTESIFDDYEIQWEEKDLEASQGSVENEESHDSSTADTEDMFVSSVNEGPKSNLETKIDWVSG